MTSEHKSYGYEGGYNDWTTDKVIDNMRLMSVEKKVTSVAEKEEIGEANVKKDYSDTEGNREE